MRVLKGLPGSGKTTALWEAAVRGSGRDVLYLTWSPELASEASQWFGHAAESTDDGRGVRVRAWDLRTLLGEVLSTDLARIPRSVRLTEFGSFLKGLRLPQSALKPWRGRTDGLYDELRVGAISRFVTYDKEGPRLDTVAYKQARAKEGVPKTALDAALVVLERLPLDDRTVAGRLFPEPIAALQARHRLTVDGIPSSIVGITGLVVDETQDLSPADLSFLRALVTGLGSSLQLVLAGDEGQTVRPTGFAWASVKRTFSTKARPAEERVLRSSLRCSRKIAEALERATDLYRELPKELRPGDGSWSDASDLPEGTITLVEVADAETARSHLRHWLDSDQVALCASLDGPAWLQDLGDDELLTPHLAKGLEYPRVCIVGAVATLRRILNKDCLELVDHLHRRTLLDGLRVALSRAADDLILLELADDLADDAGAALQRILGVGPSPATHLIELAVTEDDQQEVVGRLLNLTHALLPDRPDRAWQVAQRALRIAIEEEHDPAKAAQNVLVIAAGLLTAPDLPSTTPRTQILEALAPAAEIGGTPRLAQVLQTLDRPFQSLQPEERAAWLLNLAALPPSERLAGLLPALRARRQQFADDLSHTPKAWSILAQRGPDALHEATRWLEIEDRLTGEDRSTLCVRAAEQAIAASDHDAALSILCNIEGTPIDLLGRAAEGAGRLKDAVELLIDQDRVDDALELARDYGQIQRAAELEARLAKPGAPTPSGQLAEIERSLLGLLAEGHLRPAERCAIARAVDIEAAEVARAVERDRERLAHAMATHEARVARANQTLEAQQAAFAVRKNDLDEAERDLMRRQGVLTAAQRRVEERGTHIDSREKELDKRETEILEWAVEAETRLAELGAAEKEAEIWLQQREAEIKLSYSQREAAIGPEERRLQELSAALERRCEALTRFQLSQERRANELQEREDAVRQGLEAMLKQEQELANRERAAEQREKELSARAKSIMEHSKRFPNYRYDDSNTPPSKTEKDRSTASHEPSLAATEPEQRPESISRYSGSVITPWALSSHYKLKKVNMLPLMERCGIMTSDWETPLSAYRAKALEDRVRNLIDMKD